MNGGREIYRALRSFYRSSELEIASSTVCHFPGAFSGAAIAEAEARLSAFRFAESRHQGRVARLELSIETTACSIAEQVHDLLAQAKKHLWSGSETRTELFAFRYDVGHFVPRHRDNTRHLVVAMAYLGDFEGGEFVLFDHQVERTLALRRGDLLVSVNTTPSGLHSHPEHLVRPVTAGSRLVVAGSLVSS